MNNTETCNDEQVIIWLDLDIYNENTDYRLTVDILQEINCRVLLFNNSTTCVDHIRSIENTKIFLIISGFFAKQILADIHQLKGLHSIYIFCTNKFEHEHLCTKYRRIAGIYTDRKSLKNSIERNIHIMNKQAFTISLFDQKQKLTKVLSKESGLFLWFQILRNVLKQIDSEHSDEAKQQMINICKNYYQNDVITMKQINKFKESYKSNDAIKWYTAPTFLYRTINQALRTEDLKLMFSLRFFIVDLSIQIHRLFDEQKNTFDLLYRGQILFNEEFQKINNNIGSLISVNTFFSTTKDIEIAKRFVELESCTEEADKTGVLFYIRIDTLHSKTIIFADIEENSLIPDEKEVLFDIGSVFEIENVTYDDHSNLWKVFLVTTDKGSYHMQNYTKFMEYESQETNPAILFGSLLIDIGYTNFAKSYLEYLLETPMKYDQDLANIYHNLGRAIRAQGNFFEAKIYYEYAYEIRKTRDDKFGIARSLIGLGYIYYVLGYHDRAIEYNQQGILLLKYLLKTSDHILIGLALLNIGSVYFTNEKYDVALFYFLEQLFMHNRLFDGEHHYSISPLIEIGNVYRMKQDYKLASRYYKTALMICEKHLPSDSPLKLNTYSRIAYCFEEIRDNQLAFEIYEKILIIQKKFYSESHPNIAQIQLQMEHTRRESINKST
ncbi:unnamed protein product [Adineta ricciae]|uniref:Uncharacterized protein n=1 Tax=Adineta ricciae TaxID=249248 RepID=A0A816B7Y8_ADIRI|nr:unnamed protein product [Adineta ricciae]